MVSVIIKSSCRVANVSLPSFQSGIDKNFSEDHNDGASRMQSFLDFCRDKTTSNILVSCKVKLEN